MTAIEEAVALARSGAASGVVTNPIHKATLYEAGFKFPGHTEYLACSAASTAPVMMLAIEGLRVVPVTRACVARASDQGADGGRDRRRGARPRTRRSCATSASPSRGSPSRRSIRTPGEDGAMGDEEQDDHRAGRRASSRRRASTSSGPLPADTLFHAGARARYDAAICMYHDQALIPLKTLDFAGGVNVTLGLPIVRTSPDHGTALDIAGQDRADPSSLLAALRLAETHGGERARARNERRRRPAAAARGDRARWA